MIWRDNLKKILTLLNFIYKIMNCSCEKTKLSERLYKNSIIVRALSQLFSVPDREKVRLWLSRLHHIREDLSLRDLEIYEEYMWFLRTVMEMGCLYTPFNKNPPPTTCDLIPLQIVVPHGFYNTAVQNCRRDDVSEKLSATSETRSVRSKAIYPNQFLYEQPVPNKGVICYMAVFSDS